MISKFQVMMLYRDIIINVIAFTSLQFTFYSHLLNFISYSLFYLWIIIVSRLCLFIVTVSTFHFICCHCWFLCTHSSKIWVGISVSLFFSCYWYFCPHLLVVPSCSRLFLMLFCYDLSIVLDLFTCLYLLLVPLLFPWLLLVLFWLWVIDIGTLLSQRLYPWLVSSSTCLFFANM